MKREKQIKVLASTDIDTLESSGADVEQGYFETLASAKQRAKYLLTNEYRKVTESSIRLGYSRVLVDGVCIADYFAEVR
jgi:hypothetical protein